MDSFGELLRGYRGTRGLTQEELAERSGLSVYAISMLERGARTAPRSSTVELLARALQLDASERAALVAAARAARVGPAARLPAPRPAPARPRVWSVSVLALPRLWMRRAAAALAGLLLVLAVGAVAYLPLGPRPEEAP